MELCNVQPAGEVPPVEQPEERLRRALARMKGAIVRKPRKQSARTSRRLDPLAVDEVIPAAKQHPRARIQAQAVRAATDCESRGCQGPVRAREDDAQFGL